MEAMTDDARVFLSTLPPERGQRRLALGVVVASIALFVAAVPFAKIQLPRIWAFVPIYQSAMIISDLLTAALLIGQYNILRSRAILVLAGGYLLTASTATVHMLSFPGLFAPQGLLGAGPQTTAWLYMFWHAGFPLAVIAYTWLRAREQTGARPAGPAAVAVVTCIGSVLALVIAFAVLTTVGHDRLPRILDHELYTPAYIAAITSVCCLTGAALLRLWRLRPQSMLDLWLMVVMFAWLFDIALAAALNHRRFDLGFFAGRAYGLLAASFVLIALTFENIKLYARIVAALDRERTERRLVQERTAELNEAKALLEQRVAARTAALAASNRDLLHEVAERKRAEGALRQSQAELRELASISSSAREQEKRRIARELHDELAQTLATLRLELDRLAEQVPAGTASAEARVADMRVLVDDAVASTRRIAADLRPMMLDDLGLVAAVQWLAQAFRQRYGFECTVEIDPEDLQLDEPYATTAYRIVQESLTNVARHARASHVGIDLVRHDGQIVLRVRDDGLGFDLSARRKPSSFGLAGLRERAYLVEGRISIQSAPGQGTAIEVLIPLPATQEPAAS
ncbi:sensor histidine kinase [Trinickia caryophylli]|uniref:sensor histidine kinase n=1 Tax=Trinickia caryophylli TaxID=28094 RepID=UPI000C881D98|nr:sensor histidine kinase [Trinickia caryophylli]PMS11230.1 sensor histidine kinase [Trinickia caryophylli]WQE12565.1 sensor histidine kinase [Trinickia caryophylli]